MKWFFYLCKIIAYIPLRLVFPFKIIGKKRLPKQNYVSISNHLAATDVVALALYMPRFRHFLAKKELGEKKLSRFFLRQFGAIFIDREKMDIKAIKTAIACLKKSPLSVFPEGTRNKTGDAIQAVKGGAAMIAVKAEACVVPIMLHHKSKAFKRNFIFVGEVFNLPFAPGERFNNESMNKCTAIISDAMQKAKDEMDIIVENKSWRAYNKQIKAKIKSDKLTEKLLKKTN